MPPTPVDPSKKFSTILSDSIDRPQRQLNQEGINQYSITSNSFHSNKNPVIENDPKMGNYNWTWSYFDFSPDLNYPAIFPNVFSYAQGPIHSQIINSKDGNLTIGNINPNQINKFSANVFSINGTTTSLNISWNGAILSQVNGVSNIRNGHGRPYNRNDQVNITLNTGWNVIDFYLYSPSGNSNFSINNPLGEVVDHWGTSTISPPTIPSGLSVSSDLNSVGKRDPYVNVLKWRGNSQASTAGYDIYRQGPYNTGIKSPSGILSLSSGYYISGRFVVPTNYSSAYYKISALNSGGETLTSSELKLTWNTVPSGISYISGLSYSGIPISGYLATGIYHYYLMAKSYAGQYIHNGNRSSISIFNSGSSVLLNWSGIVPNYGIDIYRTNRNFDFSLTSFSGLFITGVTTQTSFIDSGYQGALITGLNILGDWRSKGSINTLTRYADNSFIINWSGTSGATNYNIYRTNYSGIYQNGSLIAQTTGTFYIDSGITSSIASGLNSKPISFEHIASIGYGLPLYKDVGVYQNKTYDYAISAYDFNFIESNKTQSVTITAGNPNAPNTPSGITINFFNGFATIGWQNGVEPDLAGTVVYESVDGIVPFIEIGRTVAPANSLTEFVGYSGIPLFKLANFNTSNNTSALSSSVLASGMMIASQIQLDKFSLMPTIDLDLDYYWPSGMNGSTNGISYSSLVPPVPTPGTGSVTPQVWALVSLNTNSPTSGGTPSFSGINLYSTISSIINLDSTPSIISGGISTIYMNNTTLSGVLMFNYYSGNANSQFLHYRTYSGNLSNNSYGTMTTSTTGINIGNYLQSITVNNLYQFVPVPRFITYANVDPNNNTMIFLSGNTNDNISIGFLNLNYKGVPSGPPKYLNIYQSAFNNGANDFDATFDTAGNIDLMWSNGGFVYWYKVNTN